MAKASTQRRCSASVTQRRSCAQRQSCGGAEVDSSCAEETRPETERTRSVRENCSVQLQQTVPRASEGPPGDSEGRVPGCLSP